MVELPLEIIDGFRPDLEQLVIDWYLLTASSRSEKSDRMNTQRFHMTNPSEIVTDRERPL